MAETLLQTNGNKQVPRKSYDLSTSAKWATLSSGNHNVQIVAKASGYRDSEPSAAVTVNKTIISAGTYKFNDTIVAPVSGSATAFIHFKVNDTSYNSIGVTSLVSVMYTETLGAGLTVYNNTDKWAAVDTANQIITITADKEVPNKFYEWFTANASAYTPTVTLEAGTYKFADSLDWNNQPVQSLSFICNGSNYVKFNFDRVTDTYLAKLRFYINDVVSIDVCNVTEDGSLVWLNSAYKKITLSASQQVSAEFYKWSITDGNLVKQVEPTGESWLLNETIDTSNSVNITSNISCTINLLIDNQGTYISKSGTTINVSGDAGGPYTIDVDSSGNRLVYYDALGGWNSQYNSSYYKTNDTSKLRTITFPKPPTGELLTWLQDNGNKQ